MAAEEKSEAGPPKTYKCRYCGKQGGAEGSHWDYDCPDLKTVRTQFSDLGGVLLPAEQRDLIVKYCLSNSNTPEKAVEWLKASLGVTKEVIARVKKEVIARDDVPSTAAELTCAVCARCHGLSAEAVARACRKLADEGYQQLEALQEAKDGRNEWVDFAARVRVPDIVIERLAQIFGPSLPSARDIMTLQDRLDAELRGWFGDYDNIASVIKIEEEKGERGWYQSGKMFLIHDTTVSSAERVCQEGHLKAQQANDTAYDGHLAYGEAPAVVFFQASDFGENKSIYPRQTRDGKRRFLVPPQQLAIHTNSFLMYFVKISESRRSTSDESTLLQLHVLFLPATHAKRAFCDKHFLMVNKQTFQPFHYDLTKRQWRGFTGKKGTGHVDGRGVMVNVCVAQDVPINLPVQLFHRGYHYSDPAPLAADVGGIIAPPIQEGIYIPSICMFWLQGNCTNSECKRAHVSWYAFQTQNQDAPLLEEIWSETIANPASAEDELLEEGAAAPGPAAVEATPEMTQGAWSAGPPGQGVATNVPASRPAVELGAVGTTVTKRQAPRLPEPWSIPGLWSIHEGTVKKILKFGAIVSIDNYDDGLVHISKLRDDDKRIADIADVVSIGVRVRVVVTDIKDGQKVELSMKQVDLTRAQLKTNQRWN